MPNQKSLTTKKSILIMILFLLLLTSFHLAWINYHTIPDHPEAKQGAIDLSDWKFTDDQAITLNGEWEFYPNQLIEPNAFEHHTTRNHELISVPGDWNKAFLDKDDSYGFGTYRMKVKLPDDAEQLYGIRVKDASTSARMYINGNLVSESGQVKESTDKPGGYAIPFFTTFSTNNGEIDLMIHVSNHENYVEGGLVRSVQIGTNNAITEEAKRSTTLQTVVSMVFFLHSLYAIIIYFISKRGRKEFLYFALLLLIQGFTILIDDDGVLYLPISAEIFSKLISLLFMSTLFMLALFIKHLFTIDSKQFKWLSLYYILLTCSIIIVPINHFSTLGSFMALFYVIVFSYLFIRSFRAIKKKYNDAIYVLLLVTTYFSGIVWGLLGNLSLSHVPFYPFDFIISIIMIVVLLIRQHLRVIQLNEKQTIALQKADKAKDEFLTHTSNELREPLHGMINLAESLLDGRQDTFTHNDRANLSLLTDIGVSMDFTLKDLAMISNLKDGKVTLKKTQVHLHTATAMVIDMLQYSTDEKPLTLINQIPPYFPEVWADEDQLMQVLFNLIHNAIKYTDKGSIIVSAAHSHHVATIYVKDTGIGISPAQAKDTVFRPYEAQADTTHTAHAGIGIGLNVSKQLVELHGGTMTYHSDKSSTTFLFTIPLSQNVEQIKRTTQSKETQELTAATVDNQPVNQSNQSPDQHILLVHHDLPSMKVLRNMLNQHYHVSIALSGEQALQAIMENEFDLIISEVKMPHMNGYELTRNIRNHYTLSELPILLMGDRRHSEDIYAVFEFGANGYLIKPVSPLELKTRVKAIMELKQSIREALYFEAAWLQAQINPHFLLNTLNSIASLAEIDTDRMTALLKAFGTYLQRSFSVNNTKAKMPLADELELTKAYVYIENARFGERLHVTFNMDDYLHVNVPPLSIQPLVENAIKHGVLKKTEGGTVTISAEKKEDDLIITIEDDGVGMTQETVNDILQNKYVLGEGVGFKNTNRRLYKLYGDGLHIKSELNEGTIVSFTVPYET